MKQIDATLWVESLAPELQGIGRYTWELSQGLPRVAGIRRLYRFTEGRLVNDASPLVRGEALPPIHRRFGRLQGKWERARLRRRLFHGPNFFLPQWVELGVITVHDLSVLRFPETHPEARLRDYEEHFERSLRQARHVITVSETVRQEVLSLLGLPADQVTAVHNGVSPVFRPYAPDELREALAPLGLLPGGYGLCVAALEPRKKLLELLQAWEALPKALRSRFPLVLAGAPGWSNHAIHRQIERGMADGWLIHPGYVAETLLPKLYSGARLFIYPSTYEGFGLPPLEAMACAVPVVVAGKSCLPEICGNAARFIDPDVPETFAQAIEQCLTDEAWRAQAIGRGLIRAQAFSWERCCRETAAVYAKAVAAR